ncbi:MAG: site-specific DNA-methyltransferase, partial [Gorillibacterium sp.]|nr:site-specific DNA-methyltransferase [Gorillibacterium sp.]
IQAIHRIYRFLQPEQVIIDIIYMDSEEEILQTLLQKWKQHNYLTEQMIAIIKKYGLSGTSVIDKLARSIGVERVKIETDYYSITNNDCVLEAAEMEENSIDLILTSIPFGNHYEYTPSYNDFGHTEDTAQFFEQMDFLTPQLLRVLKPGRVAAIHVKDRVLFGNATGDGMPTMEPFHMDVTAHFRKRGFKYFGMITVVTDVVRENNQTYRLGWSEQCKDGTKMGVGCPEYILLFRKLPSDTSTAYADDPVIKTKEQYTRAQWQIDAHGYWRSSGDRLMTKEELVAMPVNKLQAVYRKFSRENIYNYEQHVEVAKRLDKDGKLPASFMVVAPGSWTDEVWDDINRMRTLNTTQSQRRQQMHVCPLQIDIVDRIINRYSNPGDVVFDPFGGLMTVPVRAVKLGRKGRGVELNADYFRDGAGYLRAAEALADMPTLFDLEDLN